MQEFTNLNLMAGTTRRLEQELLTPDENEIWNRDFALLCDDLIRLVDPELGEDLRREKPFYDAALQVAKGSFDKMPFGGLKAATGQFGFRLIAAQDLKEVASEASTPWLYDWAQTHAITSGQTEKAYAYGYSSGKVFACNEASHRAVLAWHRLLSYKPEPKLVYVRWVINDFPYVPYCVEPYSKITKENKLFKIIPMPGRILIHPGGGFYADFYFDRGIGATAPSGTKNIDVEIALFGLVYGEFDYLDYAEIT
ncbi:hypothetical protein ES703_98285 [subsurface metagenome]